MRYRCVLHCGWAGKTRDKPAAEVLMWVQNLSPLSRSRIGKPTETERGWWLGGPVGRGTEGRPLKAAGFPFGARKVICDWQWLWLHGSERSTNH